MRATLGFALLVCAAQSALSAGIFGEGYSSAEVGTPSPIYFRAFTIYTGQEACEHSLRPVEFKILPNPLRLTIGDRVHHTGLDGRPSDLVIEAYDAEGAFLPSVPVTVAVISKDNVTDSRSNWDYMEAVRDGQDELRVVWACTAADGRTVETRIPILVTSEEIDSVVSSGPGVRGETT